MLINAEPHPIICAWRGNTLHGKRKGKNMKKAQNGIQSSGYAGDHLNKDFSSTILLSRPFLNPRMTLSNKISFVFKKNDQIVSLFINST